MNWDPSTAIQRIASSRPPVWFTACELSRATESCATAPNSIVFGTEGATDDQCYRIPARRFRPGPGQAGGGNLFTQGHLVALSEFRVPSAAAANGGSGGAGAGELRAPGG